MPALIDPAAGLRLAGRLEGRTAIVSGGGTAADSEPVSIGYAICLALAAAGAEVAVLDLDAKAAARTAAAVEAQGGRALAVVGNVASTADCDRAVAEVRSAFDHLDVVVSNAATLGTAWTIDAPDEAFRATFEVNHLGALRLARAAVPHLAPGSAIVNIASIGATRSFGSVDYAASKGAMLGATTALAAQLGPKGIRVNAVSPGTTWAQMGERRLRQMGASDEEIREQRALRAASVPLAVEGTGWDIGHAVAFLASDDARWVTGQDLVVDAGLACVGAANLRQPS
jgi:NAD(P)-dependent dehydrogenase (short-subunit alcohol dehydrogenase family)